MEISRLGLIVVRALQLFFAVVVLGLSAHMATVFSQYETACKTDNGGSFCNEGGWPAAVEFSAFAGAWGLVDSLVGFAQIFAGGATMWLAIAVFDGLTAIFYLADGINLAVRLSKVVGCDGNKYCTELRADTAFAFLGFFGTLAALILIFLAKRN